MGLADDEFGRGNYSECVIRILLASSIFKKSIRARYLTSNAKKDDQATKKGNKGAKSFKYLTSDAKKTFNLLQHTFT